MSNISEEKTCMRLILVWYVLHFGKKVSNLKWNNILICCLSTKQKALDHRNILCKLINYNLFKSFILRYNGKPDVQRSFEFVIYFSF